MPRGPFDRSCLMACLLLSASPALAQSPTITLDDPSYLPGEGQLVTDSALSYERARQDAYQSESYTLSHAFRYGLTSDLIVGIGESCAYRDEAIRGLIYDFGSITSFTIRDHHTGCDDPFIAATYRLWRQGDSTTFPVNLDLSARFSPDIFKAQYGTISTAPGGESGDVNLALSHVLKDMTVLGRVGVSLNGKTKAAGSPGNYTEFSAYARPYAEAIAQYRFDENFALSAGVRGYLGYHTTESRYNYIQDFYFGSPGTEILSQSNNKMGYEISPAIAASVVLIPDFLAASLSYRHSFIGAENDYMPFFPGFTYDSEIGGKSADGVMLSVRVLWF